MYILKYLLSFSKISTFNCVSRQVINEKSRGGDLAIDECIASSMRAYISVCTYFLAGTENDVLKRIS
jgi:hypothetical protein